VFHLKPARLHYDIREDFVAFSFSRLNFGNENPVNQYIFVRVFPCSVKNERNEIPSCFRSAAGPVLSGASCMVGCLQSKLSHVK
jgi:hypothetical protein